MLANDLCYKETFTEAKHGEKFHFTGPFVTVQAKLTGAGPVQATVTLYGTNTFPDNTSWIEVGSKTFTALGSLHVDMFDATTAFAFGKVVVSDLTGEAVVSVSTAMNGTRSVQNVNIVGAAPGGMSFTIDSVNLDAVGQAADTPATSDSGSFGLIALLKRGLHYWSTLLDRIPTKGAAAANASMPVVLASNDAQIGAKATTAVIDAGGSGLLGWLSTIASKLARGRTASANSHSVTLASDDQQVAAIIALLSCLPASPSNTPILTKTLLDNVTQAEEGVPVTGVARTTTISVWGKCDEGTGQAMIEFYGSMNGGLSWDTIPIATIVLNLIAEKVISEGFTSNHRYPYVCAVVKAISGTGAKVSSVMGY